MSPVRYPVRADQGPLLTCIVRNGDFLGGEETSEGGRRPHGARRRQGDLGRDGSGWRRPIGRRYERSNGNPSTQEN